MKLSFLDLGLLAADASVAETLAATVAYARTIEDSGFDGICLGEHHDHICAWSSCVPVISMVAENTERIMIRTSGALLLAYNPVALASDISLLNARHGHRIELGIARGVPTLNGNRAMLCGVESDRYDSVFADKLKLLFYLLSSGKSHADLSILPAPSAGLDVALLGSGTKSYELANTFGAKYIHSLFHRFSSPQVPPGTSAVAVAGICGGGSNFIEERLSNFVAVSVTGGADECWDQLTSIAAECAVEDVIFVDCGPPESRLETVRALADAKERAARSGAVKIHA